jgi:hypothetical protein
MARYFFHLHDHTGFLEDEEGREFPGLEKVREAALKDARSVIGQDVEHGVVDLWGRIEVVDMDGAVVLALPFIEAVRLKAPPGSSE